MIALGRTAFEHQQAKFVALRQDEVADLLRLLLLLCHIGSKVDVHAHRVAHRRSTAQREVALVARRRHKAIVHLHHLFLLSRAVLGRVTQGDILLARCHRSCNLPTLSVIQNHVYCHFLMSLVVSRKERMSSVSVSRSSQIFHLPCDLLNWNFTITSSLVSFTSPWRVLKRRR